MKGDPALGTDYWVAEYFDDGDAAAEAEREAYKTIFEATRCQMEWVEPTTGETGFSCPDEAAVQALEDFLGRATSERPDDPTDLYIGLLGHNAVVKRS
jgi:hypothetical protein